MTLLGCLGARGVVGVAGALGALLWFGRWRRGGCGGCCEVPFQGRRAAKCCWQGSTGRAAPVLSVRCSHHVPQPNPHPAPILHPKPPSHTLVLQASFVRIHGMRSGQGSNLMWQVRVGSVALAAFSAVLAGAGAVSLHAQMQESISCSLRLACLCCWPCSRHCVSNGTQQCAPLHPSPTFMYEKHE